MKLLLGRLILGCLLALLVVTDGAVISEKEKSINQPEASPERIVYPDGSVIEGRVKHFGFQEDNGDPDGGVEHEIVVFNQASLPSDSQFQLAPLIIEPLPPPQSPAYHPPQVYTYYQPPSPPKEPLVVSLQIPDKNIIKPIELLSQGTGHLWNLIDQKNSEFWEKFQSSNSGGGQEIHLVIDKNNGGGGGGGGGGVGGGGWFNKGKILENMENK